MAPRQRIKDKAVKVLIGDKQTAWTFVDPLNGKSLEEQIAQLCADQEVLYDDDENVHVLYYEDERGTPLISQHVSQLDEAKDVKLGKLLDIVEQTLTHVEESRHDVYPPWIASIGTNAGYVPYTQEVIMQGGIRVLLQTLPELPDVDVRDLVISCFASIFSCDLVFDNRKLIQEILETVDSSEMTELFNIIITRLLSSHSTRSPESLCASAVAVFLLEFSPDVVFQAHAACTNNELYDLFAEQIDDENDAASFVLSSMWHDSQVRDACGLLGVQPRIDQKKRSENGTTDLYMMKASLASAGDALRYAKAPQSQSSRVDRRRLQEANQRINALESEMRRTHNSRIRMMRFMRLPVPDLEGYLDAVVQNGWDSMTYEGNYSPLHLVAECYDEPHLVELFAYLASDIDAPDDRGFTAAHYAKKAGMLSNYDMLRRVRIARKQQIDVNAHRTIPSDISEELHAALDSVVQNGWDQIEWPDNFSALHFAAMQGSASAVSFLLTRQGVHTWLAVNDNTGRTPLDYALLKHKHNFALCDLLRTNAGAAPRQSADHPGAQLAQVASIEKPNEELLRSLLEQLDTFGKERLLEKLKTPKLQGGMEANEVEANMLIEKALAYRAELDRQNEERDDVERRGTVVTCRLGEDGGDGKGASSQNIGKQSSPKGGKGPPAPGGKSGKGPPVPQGKGVKGPPAPAGKGGKGSPALVGKGWKGAPKARGRGAADLAKIVKPLKPLWWTKYNLGRQILQDSPSIWLHVSTLDEVKLFGDGAVIDTFIAKFSKTEKDKTITRGCTMSKQKVKVLRVVTDPQIIVGKEAALKSLLPPETLVIALQKLDEVTISTDVLKTIIDHAMPKTDQLQRLGELRRQHPNLPMALPETYMYHIGKILAFQPRLECWLFTRTFQDVVDDYSSALKEFIALCKCFLKVPVAKLFALMLGVGNTLNGHSDRGQADGFSIDTLGKLDTIKDNVTDGYDVRHFIMSSFIKDPAFEAQRLVEDLTPFFLNVRRRMVKDKEGHEKLSKTVRICLEDYSPLIRQFATDFEGKKSMLQMCLQYIEDACDPIRFVLTERFAQAKKSIDALLALRDDAVKNYEQLQAYFHTSLSSQDLQTMLDDFFIPPDVVIDKPEHVKKKVLSPLFCSGKRFDLEAFKILWDVRSHSADTPCVRKAVRRNARVPQELPKNWFMARENTVRPRVKRHGTLHPQAMMRDALRPQKCVRGHAARDEDVKKTSEDKKDPKPLVVGAAIRLKHEMAQKKNDLSQADGSIPLGNVRRIGAKFEKR